MNKTTKFKVECEIEVEYNVDKNCPNTPYSYIGAYCKDGIASMIMKEGKIIDIKMVNLERKLEENKNEN